MAVENAERVAASSDHGQAHDAKLARIVAAWSELPAVLKGRCWRLWTWPARRVGGEVGWLTER
ncbi:MAG: hypothetical protein ACKV2Q_29320 [Planctomycetaceae bacterium]